MIDCSYAAGKAIGLDKTGLTRVKLTVVGFGGKIYESSPAGRDEPVPSIRLSDFGVQVGAFRREEGARIYRQRYLSMVSSDKKVVIRRFIVGAAPLYRVWVMGFGSESEARNFIARYNVAGGFLIRP